MKHIPMTYEYNKKIGDTLKNIKKELLEVCLMVSKHNSLKRGDQVSRILDYISKLRSDLEEDMLQAGILTPEQDKNFIHIYYGWNDKN